MQIVTYSLMKPKEYEKYQLHAYKLVKIDDTLFWREVHHSTEYDKIIKSHYVHNMLSMRYLDITDRTRLNDGNTVLYIFRESDLVVS